MEQDPQNEEAVTMFDALAQVVRTVRSWGPEYSQIIDDILDDTDKT